MTSDKSSAVEDREELVEELDEGPRRPLTMPVASLATKLRCITVDATGTLIRYSGHIGDFYCGAATAIGKPCPDYERMHQGFQRAYKDYSTRYPCFGYKTMPTMEWWHAVVKNSFREAGYEYDQVSFSKIFKRIYAMFGSKAAYEAFPDSAPFLRWVRSKGLVTGVISNAAEEYRDAVLPLLGLTQVILTNKQPSHSGRIVLPRQQCHVSSATSAVPCQQCHVSNSATSATMPHQQQCHVRSATSAVPHQQQCHVSSATSATVPCQQCPATMTGSALGMPGQLANESIAEYKQRFQTQLALIKAEEQRQVAAEAVCLQAEAAATAEKQRLQAEAEADTQARRKEAQDLLQQHEATSIEKLKFWHIQPSEEHDDATPEEQHKEFMAKLVTLLVYTCNHLQSELANLQRAVRNHKAQHDDAARALDSCVQDLEQTAPRPEAGESSSAPSARQLEERVDHVVVMLGDISTFAAPATISNQLDTLKTEVQQLQLPNKDGNITQHYKMPTFQIEKFDDYTHQDPVLWWEGFTTQLRILFVAKHAYIGALFLNSKGGCQFWLSHLATVHGVDVADLKDKISWEELTRLWKKRFIVDDAPTLAINRLFAMTQGNTSTPSPPSIAGDSTIWSRLEELDPLTFADFQWMPLPRSGRLPRPHCNLLMAQLQDYLHTAVPTPLMDAGVEVVDLHDYIAKIDRRFKTQLYDDIDAPLLYVRIQIGDATCSALIDCGASRNYMSQDFMVRAGLGPRARRKSQPTQVTLADGHTHKSIDWCIDDVPVYFAPHASEAVSFDILDTKFDMILGMSWLRSEDHPVNFYRRTVHVCDRNGVLVPCTVAPPHPSISCHVVFAASMRASITRDDIEEMGVCFFHALPSTDPSSDPRIAKLLDAYGDVFEGPHGVVPDQPIRHEIILEDRAVPLRGCINRMSEEELSVLRAQRDDLLEKGWIRPSSSPYGALVLFVRKKNKDLRLCIDYRKLNAQTVRNAGPFPRIDDLLERLGRAKFFSKLDLKSGNHQLQIRQEDRYKTAFKTRYGHFEWLVMPFGLTNAPTTFQVAMTTEFRHMLDQFVLIYLDDILVYSRSLDEHVEHLCTVLERLRQAKYKANRDKCEFTRQELEYLGHYVMPQGIRPLADKIEALRIWLESTNTTDVRSFMGLAGYFLEQHDGDDWHPAEYFSHKVPPINLLDDARKKELLAFVMALKRWWHFLLGRRRFTWVTDNNPLTYYKTQDTLSSDHPPASHYRIADGYLLLHSRGKDLLCVPRDRRLRTRLLRVYHDSRLADHFGVNRTIARLRQRFRWPDLIIDVTRYCDSCKVCRRSKPHNRNPYGELRPMPIPREPGFSIAMDVIGPFPRDRLGHDGILTVVDRLCRIFADLLLPRPADIDAACSLASVRKYRELLARACANMQKAQVRMQQQANRRRVPCPIRAGDLVWVSAEEFALEQDVSCKLLPKWFGPWPVTSAAGDEPDGPSFVINIPPHLMVHPVFHASKLATYTPAKSDDFSGRRSQDPPSMDGHQEVDRVITDRKYGSKPRQYKVTFKACDPDDTRWFSGTNLKASAPLIYAHYERQRLAQGTARPAPPTWTVVPPLDRQLRPRRWKMTLDDSTEQSTSEKGDAGGGWGKGGNIRSNRKVRRCDKAGHAEGNGRENREGQERIGVEMGGQSDRGPMRSGVGFGSIWIGKGANELEKSDRDRVGWAGVDRGGPGYGYEWAGIKELGRVCGLRLGTGSEWDFGVFSGLVGVEKPDHRIYEMAMQAAGSVLPSQVLHIGDSYQKDYLPARQLGMHALLVDRFSSKEADEWRRQNLPVVKDLEEAKAWIREQQSLL
ncbi:hypothetical protein CBR_g46238 [Chara braunii]|uniref:RNA-directed DNA polymerase n=1 Tax=Chara braunii TaxID=69332 RepID=A0A388K3S7_CHABU|nr:hypothetical protein CBR_g46238 [Chara braunii]|eukprot:GBG64695.1 hypothetical protein CBR_g46238 [Chara braunii]